MIERARRFRSSIFIQKTTLAGDSVWMKEILGYNTECNIQVDKLIEVSDGILVFCKSLDFINPPHYAYSHVLKINNQGEVTSVAELGNTIHNEIYPNPSSDYIYLPIGKKYKLLDQLGRQILSGPVNGPINIQNLNPGLYYAFVDDIFKGPVVISR